MISNEEYITLSLELHLFFARIMKEHSIFLKAGFTAKNSKLAKEADSYKVNFEKLLADVVRLSSGNVNSSFLKSGEVVTNYTLASEKKTEEYTGIEINSKITLMEKELKTGAVDKNNLKLLTCIKKLNCKMIELLDGFISFKNKVLDDVVCCKLFTSNYPSLLEHVIEEAKMYRCYIDDIENKRNIYDRDGKSIELFWDEIMMEHALFMRGLLDPSENSLISKSNEFANEFNELIKKVDYVSKDMMDNVTDETLKKVCSLKEFKENGVKGLLECKVKALILPLLADHVLREANFYIKTLKNIKNR